MGSSALETVGDNRGESTNVETVTLSQLAKHTKLSQVDFIKCDVESA